MKSTIQFPLILIAFCLVSGPTGMDALAGPAGGSSVKSEQAPTAIEAAAFMTGVEAKLLKLWIAMERQTKRAGR